MVTSTYICFNLGFTLLQTGSLALELLLEGGSSMSKQLLINHSSPLAKHLSQLISKFATNSDTRTKTHCVLDRDHFSGTNVYQWFSENIYQKWNKFQIWDFFFQNWNNGGHFEKKTSMVKIQQLFEQMLNIPSISWRTCKNWFFMFTTFLARGIFLIH